MLPLDRWQPLSVDQVAALFASAPFQWYLAGGFAIEQFVGRSLRSHGDIDVVIFRDDQLALQRWLSDWHLYAADPPGTLRFWSADEFLRTGIHDIWTHQPESDAWQLQIMLAEVEASEWYSRHNPLIRGQRRQLMTVYHGIPCVRIEVQLLYKSRQPRPQDELDFQASLPLIDADAKTWLRDMIDRMHPNGHQWMGDLMIA